jgi:hypothetical protein
MDGWKAQVWERLPLAEALLSCWDYLTNEAFLAEVFERYHGRSYADVISFSCLVGLVGDALVEHSGSGNRALQCAEERDELSACREAYYAKLRRIPQSLSHGFLAEATARLRLVLPPSESLVPKSLRGFAVKLIDGKKIKRAAKRLVAARKFRGSALGGKALIAVCLETGLATAMTSDLDGEANDPPLVPDLLKQIRGQETGPQLYVLDSQFCDLKLPPLLTVGSDQFVVRYHPKVSFTRDTKHRVQHGQDAQGRQWSEEWGWLGCATAKQRRYARRITLQRADDEPVIIVSSLLDADQYPANDLLELYRHRWGIERVFQQITEVYHLRTLIASTPQGTIFQCAFCLLLYNLMVVQRSYVAQTQERARESISMENLFYDTRRQLIAWNETVGVSWTVTHCRRSLTASQLARRLNQLYQKLWRERWLKAPAKKARRHEPKTETTAGGHTSIQRLIQKHLRP